MFAMLAPHHKAIQGAGTQHPMHLLPLRPGPQSRNNSKQHSKRYKANSTATPTPKRRPPRRGYGPCGAVGHKVWGSSHRVWGSRVPHKGQLAAPQALYQSANTAYYGGESPNMTSPKVSPKTAMCIQTQQQATTL